MSHKRFDFLFEVCANILDSDLRRCNILHQNRSINPLAIKRGTY